MSKIKSKDIPLSGLLTMQQVAEFGSAQISDLFFKAKDDFEKNQISKSFFDKLEDNLEEKLKKNNDIVDELSVEISRRIRTVFPEITLESHLIPLKISLEKEKKKFLELYKKEEPKPETEPKPVIKPSFAVSREKRNDNQ